jgi:hypothetical protein
VLASYGSPDDDGNMKASTKVLLAIVGFFVVVYLIIEKVF